MAAKLKKSNNIVVRLRLKEMRGSLQTHSHATPIKMFNKRIPGTLVFNLKELVPLSVLHDGHVFLGFTKDGQFVLSYTQLMETEAHTAYPYYVYHLHWWVLRPGTPQQRFKLHKVSQVRLFGEEEILADIFLLVCQWPTDHNKVLVHGFSHQNGASSDDKCLCYLTVTAVPPAGPCRDCLQLPQHLNSPGPEDSPSCPVPLRCLHHGFTLHTKYELAPPFPSFHPKVSLKLDGVIVLNTADSLVALSIQAGGEDREQSIRTGGEDREQSIHTGGVDKEQFIQTGEEDKEQSIQTGGEDREQSIQSGGGDREQFIKTGGEDREQSIHTGGEDREQSIQTGGGREQSIPMGGGDREQETVFPPVLRVDGKADLKLQENCAASASGHNQVLSSDSPLVGLSSKSNSSYVFNMTLSSGNQQDGRDKIGHPCTRCGDDILQTDSGITGTYKRCSACPAERSYASSASGAEHSRYSNTCTGKNSCNTCTAIDRCSNDSSSAKCSPCVSTKEKKNQSEEVRSLDAVNGENNSHSQEENSLRIAAIVQGTGQHCGQETAEKTSHACTPKKQDSRTSKSCDLPSDLLSAASDSSLRDSTAQDSRSLEGHDKPSDLLSDRNSTALDSKTPQGHDLPSDPVSDSSSWDSTALDCSRSPCFTFTKRQYVYSTADIEDHMEDTDGSGSEYQSMLPLEVHGAGYSHMRLCMGEDKGSTFYGQPGSVEVQELRMDAEQFICDMARQDADWGNRFVAFTDYDMQIIDVCPDSRQLVVLVLALVQARPHYGKCIPKLYQTSFTAAWDLSTGHHKTMDIQPLQEFDQAQLRKVWNPGRAMSRELQHRWMIPQGYARGVHVMTNAAVFRGCSVAMLWDPTSCIAIIP